MLVSLGAIDGAEVIDLFAGSGSFGIECLSRGAGHVTFVERDRPAAVVLGANLDRLDFSTRATVIVAGVEATVPGLGHADLAFCDPPYAIDPWPDLLPLIDADLLVAHSDRTLGLVPPWSELRSRSYGRSRIVIAERGRSE
jgi:16S rRNA (guanine966-N2)-methyltransferase